VLSFFKVCGSIERRRNKTHK